MSRLIMSISFDLQLLDYIVIKFYKNVNVRSRSLKRDRYIFRHG